MSVFISHVASYMIQKQSSSSFPNDEDIFTTDEELLFLETELSNLFPYTNLRYNTKEFWENKYRKDASSFEWYLPFIKIQPYVTKYVKGRDYALDIGCGTSSLACELSYDGFKKIISIDFSSVVISAMKERYSTNPDITWIVADCTSLNSKKKFDAIFDKGTMDCLLCNGDYKLAIKEIELVSQLLKPGGVFFLLSVGAPKTRTYLFKDNQNGISLIHSNKFEYTIFPGKIETYYLYIIEKMENLD